jgi:hypothetical protein
MRRFATASILVLLCLASGAALASGQADLFLGFKDLEDLPATDSQQEIGISLSTGPEEWPVRIALELFRSFEEEDAVIGGLPVEVEGDSLELAVGARKFWFDDKKLRPYVGGGAVLARVSMRATTRREFEGALLIEPPTAEDEGVEVPVTSGAALNVIHDEDTGLGFWIGGGAVWQVRPKIHVGLNLRYSDAGAEIGPTATFVEFLEDSEGSTATPAPSPVAVIDGSAGGLHYGFVVGARW